MLIFNHLGFCRLIWKREWWGGYIQGGYHHISGWIPACRVDTVTRRSAILITNLLSLLPCVLFTASQEMYYDYNFHQLNSVSQFLFQRTLHFCSPSLPPPQTHTFIFLIIYSSDKRFNCPFGSEVNLLEIQLPASIMKARRCTAFPSRQAIWSGSSPCKWCLIDFCHSIHSWLENQSLWQ